MTSYLVGIDLGTSNTVLAYAEAGQDAIRLLPIEQLVGPGEVAERPLLPSLRYHPAPGEFPPGDLALPWTTAPDVAGLEHAVVGMLARELGAQVPGRLVASAKSWLSHPAVDRTAPILPWGAPEEVPKVSPMAASASYLAHLRAAWNRRFPAAPLERQEIVLTVPASFDEGARALTVEAARQAGLPELRLLEEPQAAFYDWLFRHRHGAAEALGEARLVLVCDVGGGTTDFTLIEVDSQDMLPRLTRIGVGDHLMLGGDNMDLALAHLAERRVSEGPLSAAAFSQLVQRCRGAKEQLLAADAPPSAVVTLLGAGARLVGGARSAHLGREEVENLVVDGFFPLVGTDEPPHRRRSGIVEFGLPYPADPAITRHLAAFLHRHADAARRALGDRAPAAGQLAVPDALLLNGGVFRADALAARLVDTLARWRGAPPRLLRGHDPDVAVARGAVAYALARHGRGLRIGGGSARSYFLVVDEDKGAARGVCVLARGTEEGRAVALPERSFALRLGRPVRFHLVSSIGDTAYHPGQLVALDAEGFVRLPPIATVLPAAAGETHHEVTVMLETTMTEVGTLEMRCIAAADPARRWLLEFQLRQEAAATVTDALARLPPRFGDAVEAIERVFGSRSQAVEAKEVKRLRGHLEHLLGKRDEWDMPLLRALFDALWERARRRRRSAEHERVWLNLAGFCIRPGLGYPLDEWRVEQLWTLFDQGLQYVRDSQNWSEWWTLWRRAAGGLPEASQLRLLEAAANGLQAEPPARRRPASALHGAHDDMLRLAASLERVPVDYKLDFGEWLLERLRRAAEKPHGWWALGRVGARVPLYGSSHNVVPSEIAGHWLEALLALDWKKVEPAAFAAAQVARVTGDRGRDLPSDARETVARRLESANAPAPWIAMVRSVTALDEADERRAFGESLPPGLRLIEGG